MTTQTTTNPNRTREVNEKIVREISAAVSHLQYGNIVITVHNSKIVQMDTTEKNRFDHVWLMEFREEVDAANKFNLKTHPAENRRR